MNLPILEIIESIGGLGRWAKNCHSCSLAMIRTGFLPAGARVARGFHPRITSQHSWVVLGDPYDLNSIILDGVLWSYTDEEPYLLVNKLGLEAHRPHGFGVLDPSFRLPKPSDSPIELMTELSDEARQFLKALAPKGLDFLGWGKLANSPVLGWPSREIISAMYDDTRLRALIPIDKVGMLTDANPRGLYF